VKFLFTTNEKSRTFRDREARERLDTKRRTLATAHILERLVTPQQPRRDRSLLKHGTANMVRIAKKTQLLALLALAGAPIAYAQKTSDLPNLSDQTEEATSTTAKSTSSKTTTKSTDVSTTDSSSSAERTASSTSGGSIASTTTEAPGVPSFNSDFPTIAGAGIPTMIVPYTANAPYMQHSTLPQGTVFIVVGAVLAFLGACVLFWRALVAWSINRSVKQAAIASVTGSEKASKNGYNPVKGGLYKDAGSSMSLEALNAAGKPLKPDTSRKQPPPDGLFFSPTANRMSDANLGGSRPLSSVMGNRSSTYLPAGYYANSSAQAGGGAGATTIGGNLAPYARNSVYENSPPTTPGHTSASRNSYLRAGSRDGLTASRNSYLDAAPRPGYASGSHNARPQSNDGLPGSRAPSAYLEDLFDNHGAGPRERI
jgi:hypothetical protein